MMMKFVKMHGLGNDFIIIDKFTDPSVEDYKTLAQRWCDRHFGIGADGLIVVLPSSKADARMRIINADGSEAEMCGNGIRCFAKYVYEKGLVKKNQLTVETLAGIMKPDLVLDGEQVKAVRVNMGKPVFDRKAVPILLADDELNGCQRPLLSMGDEMLGDAVVEQPLDVDGQSLMITSMLMGVPHTMIFVPNVDEVDINNLGPKVERHPVFPKKTNVNFVQIMGDNQIKVRTWERGAGATLACGTGSCASVVASALTGRTGHEVTVHLAAGDLFIEWNNDGTVFMTGPAEEVFRGEIAV